MDRAIQAAPELRELNGRTNRRLVKRLVSLLRSSGREKISEERLEAVALVVVHASAALAQLAADPPIPSERIVPEWKLLLVSYLENYRD